MSVSNKTYVAQQETLVEVRDKIGNTDDTGGSYNSGTVNGKINTAILGISGVNNGIEGLNNRLDGVVTPYGKGTYGDLIVGPDLAWPSQDGFNRYVLHTKSMTIPEGVTLTPPEKCDGLYILSQGDVTINGVIDVRGMRKTFTEDLQLAPTINVGSQEFVLAKGGYSPIGGASGRGGKTNGAALYFGYTGLGCPALSPEETSLAGNINGGGAGAYAAGGISGYTYYYSKEGEYRGVDYNQSYIQNSNVKFEPYSCYLEQATGAVVIIAKGNVIINGQIAASATEGKNAENGGEIESTGSTNGVGTVYFTKAGDGAVPPSGGGAVTIICNELVNNGKIDTNGIKFVSPDGIDNRGVIINKYKITGSEGGKGGTFISTAGEIKVYTGVSE